MNKVATVEILRYIYAAKNRDRRTEHDPCGEMLYRAQFEDTTQAVLFMRNKLHEVAEECRCSVIGLVIADGETVGYESLFLIGPFGPNKVKTMCTKDCCR